MTTARGLTEFSSLSRTLRNIKIVGSLFRAINAHYMRRQFSESSNVSTILLIAAKLQSSLGRKLDRDLLAEYFASVLSVSKSLAFMPHNIRVHIRVHESEASCAMSSTQKEGYLSLSRCKKMKLGCSCCALVLRFCGLSQFSDLRWGSICN
jgi:hypothetical protein